MPNNLYFDNSVLRLNFNMKEKISQLAKGLLPVSVSFLYPLLYFITNLSVMIFTDFI